eukprot:g3414.t1
MGIAWFTGLFRSRTANNYDNQSHDTFLTGGEVVDSDPTPYSELNTHDPKQRQYALQRAFANQPMLSAFHALTSTTKRCNNGVDGGHGKQDTPSILPIEDDLQVELCRSPTSYSVLWSRLRVAGFFIGASSLVKFYVKDHQSGRSDTPSEEEKRVIVKRIDLLEKIDKRHKNKVLASLQKLHSNVGILDLINVVRGISRTCKENANSLLKLLNHVKRQSSNHPAETIYYDTLRSFLTKSINVHLHIFDTSLITTRKLRSLPGTAGDLFFQLPTMKEKKKNKKIIGPPVPEPPSSLPRSLRGLLGASLESPTVFNQEEQNVKDKAVPSKEEQVEKVSEKIDKKLTTILEGLYVTGLSAVGTHKAQVAHLQRAINKSISHQSTLSFTQRMLQDLFRNILRIQKRYKHNEASMKRRICPRPPKVPPPKEMKNSPRRRRCGSPSPRTSSPVLGMSSSSTTYLNNIHVVKTEYRSEFMKCFLALEPLSFDSLQTLGLGIINTGQSEEFWRTLEKVRESLEIIESKLLVSKPLIEEMQKDKKPSNKLSQDLYEILQEIHRQQVEVQHMVKTTRILSSRGGGDENETEGMNFSQDTIVSSWNICKQSLPHYQNRLRYATRVIINALRFSQQRGLTLEGKTSSSPNIIGESQKVDKHLNHAQGVMEANVKKLSDLVECFEQTVSIVVHGNGDESSNKDSAQKECVLNELGVILEIAECIHNCMKEVITYKMPLNKSSFKDEESYVHVNAHGQTMKLFNRLTYRFDCARDILSNVRREKSRNKNKRESSEQNSMITTTAIEIKKPETQVVSGVDTSTTKHQNNDTVNLPQTSLLKLQANKSREKVKELDKQNEQEGRNSNSLPPENGCEDRAMADWCFSLFATNLNASDSKDSCITLEDVKQYMSDNPHQTGCPFHIGQKSKSFLQWYNDVDIEKIGFITYSQVVDYFSYDLEANDSTYYQQVQAMEKLTTEYLSEHTLTNGTLSARAFDSPMSYTHSDKMTELEKDNANDDIGDADDELFYQLTDTGAKSYKSNNV